jgi:hypothetical protein
MIIWEQNKFYITAVFYKKITPIFSFLIFIVGGSFWLMATISVMAQDYRWDTSNHTLQSVHPTDMNVEVDLSSYQQAVLHPQSADGGNNILESYDCELQPWVVGSPTELNEAINCFNGRSLVNTYIISLTQNISLTVSSTTIDNSRVGLELTIEGNDFTVDGQNIEGVRPFKVSYQSDVIINNIKIIGGYVTDDGGGIYSSGNLTVNNSTLSGNVATEGGGGIYNYYGGVLIVNNCIFSGNSKRNAYDGGGLYNYSNSMMVVNDSTFEGNSAGARGGGIFNRINGTLGVNSSVFIGNSASNGGGVNNNSGETDINNSTFSHNSASVGGGIINFGIIHVNSSTFSGNSAVAGGGLSNGGSGTFSISNSIFARGSNGVNCYGTTISNGYNLSSDGSCNFDSPGDMNQTDPMLGILADYGGETKTYPLLPGSPAIDAGDTDLDIDQRGVSRPQGTADDIGSFESHGYNLVAVGGMEQETFVNSSFAEPLTLQVLNNYDEPVVGGKIAFTAPASGAGITFTETVAAVGVQGTVSVTVTANDIPGSYHVTARMLGNHGNEINFPLTNRIAIFLPMIKN